MIEEPGKFAEDFKKAGADILTVHIEACPNLHRNIQQIKSLGMKAGVAINPHTTVQQLGDILHEIDLVCLMSVNPGYGGQKFISHTVGKVRALKHMIKDRGLKTLIEIDGGVTLENAPAILHTGADILVAGNTDYSLIRIFEICPFSFLPFFVFLLPLFRFERRMNKAVPKLCRSRAAGNLFILRLIYAPQQASFYFYLSSTCFLSFCIFVREFFVMPRIKQQAGSRRLRRNYEESDTGSAV